MNNFETASLARLVVHVESASLACLLVYLESAVPACFLGKRKKKIKDDFYASISRQNKGMISSWETNWHCARNPTEGHSD